MLATRVTRRRIAVRPDLAPPSTLSLTPTHTHTRTHMYFRCQVLDNLLIVWEGKQILFLKVYKLSPTPSIHTHTRVSLLSSTFLARNRICKVRYLNKLFLLCVWVCVVVTAQQSRITSVYILCQSSQRIQGYRCFIALGGSSSSHDRNVWARQWTANIQSFLAWPQCVV